MEGFVYKWTNLLNGKWYVGSHKGRVDDGYTASGNLIKEAFIKYGLEGFKRDILAETDDYQELEEFILTELDAMNDPMSYNLKNDSLGGGTHLVGIPKSPEHIEAMKKAKNNGRFKKGQEPWNKGINPETTATKERRKRKEFVPMEEIVAKVKATKKERGYTNGKQGTTRSKESNKRTSESMKKVWAERRLKQKNK